MVRQLTVELLLMIYELISEVYLVDVNVFNTSTKDFMDWLKSRHFTAYTSPFCNDDTFEAFLFCYTSLHNFNFLLSQFNQ